MTARVTIVGLGLIGGSIGKALRARGWRVAYVDPAVSIDEARRAGAADERRDAISPGDELVVLATPVDAALSILGERKARGPAFFTSTCSVMAPLRDAAGSDFVAGHPFAGSERSGLAAADATLFTGRPWFIDRDDARLRPLIGDTGARSVVIDADEHDRILALTSHLPQVVATSLASLLANVDPQFIGSGAQNMLRLAGSSYEVWHPLLEANRKQIEAGARELYAIMSTLKPEDFERARELYKKWF